MPQCLRAEGVEGVGSEGQGERWGTPTMALHIRIKRRNQLTMRVSKGGVKDLGPSAPSPPWLPRCVREGSDVIC